MKHFLKLHNEKGVTLVELLAVTVVIAIVSSLVIGVLIGIQKQYTAQSDEVGGLTDVTIAAKAITKDLRSAYVKEEDVGELTPVEVESPEKVTIRIGHEEIVYELVDDVLQRNGSDYLYRVKDFYISKEDDNALVEIKIKSQTGKELEVKIVLREEF